MPNIRITSTVVANRDIINRDIVKGAKGVVVGVRICDSELYYDITLDDGRFIAASCENCWSEYVED